MSVNYFRFELNVTLQNEMSALCLVVVLNIFNKR